MEHHRLQHCESKSQRGGGQALSWIGIVTLLGGALVLSGTAYPSYARAKGWPVGAAAHGTFFTIWFLFGGLAYLAGMFSIWGWWGLGAAVPAAFLIGLALTTLLGRHVQIVAYAGPVLANVWHLTSAP